MKLNRKIMYEKERTIYETKSEIAIESRYVDDNVEPIIDEQNRHSVPWGRTITFRFGNEELFTVKVETRYARHELDENGFTDINKRDWWNRQEYLGSFATEQLYQLHAFIGSLLKDK